MTNPVTPDPTAPDPVSEARERMDGDYLCEHPEGNAERCAGRMCSECIDAFAAAVRADERARMRERIEAMRTALVARLHEPGESSISPVCYCRECIVIAEQCFVLDAVLATLREPETTG